MEGEQGRDGIEKFCCAFIMQIKSFVNNAETEI